jgi:hypothetical protein
VVVTTDIQSTIVALNARAIMISVYCFEATGSYCERWLLENNKTNVSGVALPPFKLTHLGRKYFPHSIFSDAIPHNAETAGGGFSSRLVEVGTPLIHNKNAGGLNSWFC